MTGEKPVTEQYLPEVLLINQGKVKVTEKCIDNSITIVVFFLWFRRSSISCAWPMGGV